MDDNKNDPIREETEDIVTETPDNDDTPHEHCDSDTSPSLGEQDKLLSVPDSGDTPIEINESLLTPPSPPHNKETAPQPGHGIPYKRIFRLVTAILTCAAFFAAMYTEIAAAVSAHAPESFADGAARLIFGGNYASAEQNEGSGDNVMLPPNSSAPDSGQTADNAHLTDHTTDHTIDTVDYESTAESAETPENTDDPTPADRYPIVARDLSTNAERGLKCSNQTDYELDLDFFADNTYTLPPLADLQASLPADTENPIVLIIHTHGTEAYAEEGADSYSKKDNSRSTDTTKNVVAVGEVMSNYFESRGIQTIHCTEMFDRDSYINAYTYSSAAVREYLAIYPSIKYVFDIHRDSLIADDYTKYRPVTEIDGTPTAQFMCLVGTNAKGADHPNWRDNLTLAAHLQVRLWDRSPSLPRRLSIRAASFYQQYAPGSLLFEIGSCGNSLSEAKACAQLVAEELAEIIIAGE